MISERLQDQIDALKAVTSGIISDIDGYRQTVENPKDLVLDPDNANIHNADNLQAIGFSLNQFGFRKNAIAVQEETRIVYAGNGIVQWCIENDVPVCPVVWIPAEMSEQEAKAFALADNQAPRLAEWDFDQLQETLTEFGDTFEPESLGFDADTLHEAFSEMQDVDDAVESMKPPKPKQAIGTGSGLVKLLFTPSEMPTVEKALRLANKPSRGEALTAICQAFLDAEDTDAE